jgi:hypothetical protein
MKCVADGCPKRATTVMRVELSSGRLLMTRPRCEEHAARFVVEGAVRVIDSWEIVLEGAQA